MEFLPRLQHVPPRRHPARHHERAVDGTASSAQAAETGQRGAAGAAGLGVRARRHRRRKVVRQARNTSFHERTNHGFRIYRQGQGTAAAQRLHGRAHLSERGRFHGEILENRRRASPGCRPDHRGTEGQGARSRPVEPVPAASERRRPDQPRIRAAVRDHGARAVRSEVFNCSAPDTGNMETSSATAARSTSANGSSRCCAARSARPFR